MKPQFFRFKDIEAAKKELRDNWRFSMLLRYRLRYEEMKSESIWNLVSLSAGYLDARNTGNQHVQAARLKQINKWVASFEGDSRALLRYQTAIELAKGYLVNNRVSFKEIHSIEEAGQNDGLQEAKRRGYVNG